jgi:hypothetical protein
MSPPMHAKRCLAPRDRRSTPSARGRPAWRLRTRSVEGLLLWLLRRLDANVFHTWPARDGSFAGAHRLVDTALAVWARTNALALLRAARPARSRVVRPVRSSERADGSPTGRGARTAACRGRSWAGRDSEPGGAAPGAQWRPPPPPKGPLVAMRHRSSEAPMSRPRYN